MLFTTNGLGLDLLGRRRVNHLDESWMVKDDKGVQTAPFGGARAVGELYVGAFTRYSSRICLTLALTDGLDLGRDTLTTSCCM
jgi:hypothetical protein